MGWPTSTGTYFPAALGAGYQGQGVSGSWGKILPCLPSFCRPAWAWSSITPISASLPMMPPMGIQSLYSNSPLFLATPVRGSRLTPQPHPDDPCRDPFPDTITITGAGARTSIDLGGHTIQPITAVVVQSRDPKHTCSAPPETWMGLCKSPRTRSYRFAVS